MTAISKVHSPLAPEASPFHSQTIESFFDTQEGRELIQKTAETLCLSLNFQPNCHSLFLEHNLRDLASELVTQLSCPELSVIQDPMENIKAVLKKIFQSPVNVASPLLQEQHQHHHHQYHQHHHHQYHQHHHHQYHQHHHHQYHQHQPYSTAPPLPPESGPRIISPITNTTPPLQQQHHHCRQNQYQHQISRITIITICSNKIPRRHHHKSSNYP